MKVLVVDSQGGGIGSEIINRLKSKVPEINITAVGTNSAATRKMIKAGAAKAATGENPVIVATRSADIIVGPIGIVIADSLEGEITPKIANSIGASQATRILIPYNSCNNIIVGTSQMNLTKLIDQAVKEINNIWRKKKQ